MLVRTEDWILLAVVAGVTTAAVVASRRRARRLRPSGAADLPEVVPPPVAGYDHDDGELVLDDPDDPPPSGDDYDDRYPCATQADVDEAALLGDAAGCVLPHAVEPKRRTPVPYATAPTGGGIWPVRANRRRDVRVSYQDVRGKWHGQWGRHFGAARKSQTGPGRRHAGIDLHGDAGDVVVASEAGTVEAILPFTRGTYAIYVRSDDGTMINYGEVERGSWRAFNLETGDRVEPGQSLARVGAQTQGGAHMLHVEIYRPEVTMGKIRAGGMQWPVDRDAPAELLDPTQYLLAAQDRWLADHPNIV